MMGEMGHEEELAGDHMEDEMGHEEEPAGDHMGDEDLHAAQEADDHDMSAHSAYVVPGEAHESLLYQKVSMDSPPMGESMPYGGPPLSDEQVDLIGDWIDQGAPNN